MQLMEANGDRQDKSRGSLIAVNLPSMRRPNVKVGRCASKVTRNLLVDSKGSTRLPIMFICVRSSSCVLIQTTGLSNKLNVSMKNWQPSRRRSPASTKYARPFVSIRGTSYDTAADTHHETKQLSWQCHLRDNRLQRSAADNTSTMSSLYLFISMSHARWGSK